MKIYAIFITIVVAHILSWPAYSSSPAMWQAQDGDGTTLHFFGSIHQLDQDESWNTPLLQQIIAKAPLVYYEVAPKDMNEKKITSLVVQKGMNPPGAFFSNHIVKKDRSEFEGAIKSMGLSMDLLNPMRPWMVYYMLMGAYGQKAGISASGAVETKLAKITEDEKERSLETAEEYVSILASMDDNDVMLLLMDMIRDMKSKPNYFADVVAIWKRGDTKALYKATKDSMRATPNVFNSLFVQRNLAWLLKAESLLENNEDALFIVGAGHLVGKEGLPQLLEKRGFKVKRIQ